MRVSPVVIILGLVILTSFLAFGQYAPEAQGALYDRFGVTPARYDGPFDVAAIGPLFGHVFFHYGVAHMLMNALAYMQSAPLVALRLGALRFLILFFASAVGGALAYIIINAHSQVGAVGASGAICGLFGAYFLAVRPNPRAALADPQIRNAMLGFLGVNVVLMAVLPLPIAWEAHLGGFVVGALLYPLLAPAQRGPWG